MADFEAIRRSNLAQKDRLLAELNLNVQHTTSSARDRSLKSNQNAKSVPKVKRRKVDVVHSQPSRVSARLQQIAAEAPSYANLSDGSDDELVPARTTSKSNSRKKPSRPRPRAKPKISNLGSVQDVKSEPAPDIDALRISWTAWTPSGPTPTRDEDMTWHFEDYPLFLPNKSPEEMLREGVFGGSYWRPLRSRQLGIVVVEDWRELPSSWVEGIDVDRYLINPDYDADANKYKVACGQSIQEWEAAGWIMHEFDVRGWFQWYCRFFMGRRCADDERQVSRWRKCVGATGRWKRMLLKAYWKAGVKDVFDDGEDVDEDGMGVEVSPVMHQTCFHWAIEIKQKDLDEMWRGG